MTQIGDVLCSDIDKDRDRRQYLVELKEGDANYKVLRVLEGHDNDDKLDKKYLDQMQRIIKQGKKAINALSVIKKGSGVDALGDKVKIIDSMDFEKEFFLDKINEILDRCEKYGYSTDIIDDCLYIGAYSANIPIKKAYLAFTAWIASLGISYPIRNYQDAFGCGLCIPFFMSNIDKSHIIDIALGKKIILICLDFDKWINFGATIGLKGIWLSRKESNMLIKNYSGLFTHEKRTLEVSLGGDVLRLGDGFIIRIYFEFLRPLSALKMLKESMIRVYN